MPACNFNVKELLSRGVIEVVVYIVVPENLHEQTCFNSVFRALQRGMHITFSIKEPKPDVRSNILTA